MSGVLTAEQRASWEERGFFRIASFAEPDMCEAMLHRVTRIVRQPELVDALGVKLLPESNRAGMAVANPEDGMSKIFKLHRDGVFADFAHSTAVVDTVSELIAPDIDVFLSQFIFKTAGAWGSRGTRTSSTSPSSRRSPC